MGQPWLDAKASAPAWFGSGAAASPRGHDLDAAYYGFLHESAWDLAGRSEDAAEAAAETDDEIEAELMASLPSEEAERTAHRETANEHGYRQYRAERQVEESKSGGCLRGCLVQVVRLLAIGAVVSVVLFSLDVVSPRLKPCPLDSPGILPPGQLSAAGDLFRDECVRVSGTLIDKDVDTLLLEIDRGDYAQQVVIRVPAGLFEAVSLGKQVALGGRLKVEEDGTYEVHFVQERESDRGVVAKSQENIEALF